jgi:hypothetical protein
MRYETPILTKDSGFFFFPCCPIKSMPAWGNRGKIGELGKESGFLLLLLNTLGKKAMHGRLQGNTVERKGNFSG